MCGNQCSRFDVQRICRQHKIGFVIGKKFQHRGQHGPVCQIIPQHFRRQAGQCQQAFCPERVCQHPCQRGQRQRFGIAGMM